MIMRLQTIGQLLGVAAIATLVWSCHSTTIVNESKSDKPSAVGPGGPQLGKPGGGPRMDKSDDTALQAMIRDVAPRFKQLEYTDAETGIKMTYNLFVPQNVDAAKKYPLVLFIADASTPGDNITLPLTQGWGGLVWATDTWQDQHPCFVLVPQFAGVAVNDAYQHTSETDVVIRLIKSLESDYNIDSNRLYTTGQSMGGMISMYYNVAYPNMFAASLFVDSHWAVSTFPELVKHKFVWVTAGDSGKAWPEIQPMEAAAIQAHIKYAYKRWSAKLPQVQQDSLATVLLSEGAPVNIINFAPGTVLKPGQRSEHMASFDYAYRLIPVREWMFAQTKSN